MDSNFSSVEGYALSSLLNLVTKINFSLGFQYKQLQIFLPIATSVKIAQNDEKFQKIKIKIWKDICIQEHERAKLSNILAAYRLYWKISSSTDSKRSLLKLLWQLFIFLLLLTLIHGFFMNSLTFFHRKFLRFFHTATIVFQIFSVCLFRYLIVCAIQLNNNHIINIVKCTVLTTYLNHLASMAKWLSVRLWIKWLWVRAQLQSLKLQVSHLLQARSYSWHSGDYRVWIHSETHAYVT